MPTVLLAERFFYAGERIAAAVSGGVDSVAMLELLLEARDRLGIVVVVTHFSQPVRGQASDGDESFVRQLAEQRQLEFLDSPAETLQEAKKTPSRRERYNFFRALVRQ